MKRIAVVGVVLACVLSVAGCRRTMKSEKSYSLDPNKIVVADLPAAKSIVAEFVSSDNVPVSAYLVRDEDATAALKALDDGKTIKQALASIKAVAELPKQPSGKLTSPKSENATKWSILFTTEKATTVIVKTKGE